MERSTQINTATNMLTLDYIRHTTAFAL